jgi:uncharacterized membrane protein YkvA (DUF1232 family)
LPVELTLPENFAAEICLAAAVFRNHVSRAIEYPRERQMSFWQQTSTWQGFSWQDFSVLTRRIASDEDGLRDKFWRKILAEAANLPFLEQVLTAHYCAFDRKTPLYVKVVLVGAMVYFVVPDDFIPDSLPLIGLADDAAILGGALKLMSSHIKPEHREAAQNMLARLRSEARS